MTVCIRIEHCEPDTKQVLHVTPLDENGRICGLPELLHPGRQIFVRAHGARSFSIGQHTVDQVTAS